MANINEFTNSPTNPSSPLYNGYENNIPALQSPVKPSQVFIIGTAGDATLATNGRLIITQGVSNTPGTFYKTKSYRWSRIHEGSFRVTQPSAATQKVVTITLNAPDYANTNPNGLTEIFYSFFGPRTGGPVEESTVIESPASAGETLGQRAKKIVSYINATSSLVTATSPSSGTDAAQGVITITAKKAGRDIKFLAGKGTTGAVNVTTAGKPEFGTSQFLVDQGYEATDANKVGKTFLTVDFKVDVSTAAAGHGTFVGREVGNNANALQEETVRLMFLVGDGDAKFALFNTLVQGKFTPASSYYAKAADLTA